MDTEALGTHSNQTKTPGNLTPLQKLVSKRRRSDLYKCYFLNEVKGSFRGIYSPVPGQRTRTLHF